MYLSSWIQKRLRDKSLHHNAGLRILAECSLDFSQAEDLFQDWSEAQRVVKSVRDLLRRRTDQFVLGQRGLASFLHGGLYQVDRDMFKPVSDGRPND